MMRSKFVMNMSAAGLALKDSDAKSLSQEPDEAWIQSTQGLFVK